MLIDAMLMVIFLGFVALLTWLMLRNSSPRRRPKVDGQDQRKRRTTPPTAGSDESSRITPVTTNLR